MKTIEINSLVLAYLGDSIYENYIRRHLIEQNIATVKQLQQVAIKYVSAIAQARFLQQLLVTDFFTEEVSAKHKHYIFFENNEDVLCNCSNFVRY